MRHHVLYAPSDYKSDSSFTGLAINVRPQNTNEIKLKNESDFFEIEESHFDLLSGIGKTYNYFKEINDRIIQNENKNINYNVIIITSIEKQEIEELNKRLNEYFEVKEIKINFRIYDFNE